MRNKYLYITLLAILGLSPEMLAQSKIQYAPRLVVSITIDQLRTDYLEAFSPLYSNEGFKRLLSQGMVFSNASYPYSPIDRASAIATVVTGITPSYHSIVSGQWLDHESLRPVSCTGEKQTPDLLTTSTITDELKVATEGKSKVFGVAPTMDAAILSAGHAADGAFWIDDQSGQWSISDYYGAAKTQWLSAYNVANSPAKEGAADCWEPVIELSGTFNYFQHTANTQKPFKHKFNGHDKYAQLKTSGIINGYVTNMALQCVTQETLGFDRITDFLNISYYAGTFNHAAMSKFQFEMQDTYVRLDRELANLITTIERKVGAENVLFVVTSTGYSDVESADYEKYRIPTGTFNITRASNLLNMFFGALWGQGRYIETCFRNQMFLNHQLLESKRISLTDASQRAQEFLSQMSGVRNVYSGLQLLVSNNEQIQKIRNGYNATRCGDIIIEVSPGWNIFNENTKDTQLSRASFIQFPIIFYGAGTKAELIKDRVSVDRIAPTIAKNIRIRAPNACSAEPLF
ncbi:MAG: alkaline phosphatase family protein [Prevotella sp.]|nr:alkaline phosphatase family protein [Prevotella sp.]